MTGAMKYPIGSLFDMARIPEEARGRFLAELPVMLDMAAAQIAMGDALGFRIELDGAPHWIDDDLGQATVGHRVLVNGEEVAKSSVTITHGVGMKETTNG